MHEMRSLLSSGEKRTPLARKIATRSGQGPEEASLGIIKVRRTESRCCDQRREPRKVELVDRARIRFRGESQEVIVRNVSSRGVMIESDIIPVIGGRVDIGFADCDPTPCAVRWVRDGRIGLEFARETVVLIADREGGISGRRDGERPTIAIKRERQPRQVLFLRANLHWANRSMEVKLRNVSSEGMLLHCPADILVGTPVVVEIPGGQAPSGTVRWCRSEQIGIRFDELLDVDRLVAPPAAAETEPCDYVKPDYLASDGQANSPWSARWERLSLEDL